MITDTVVPLFGYPLFQTTCDFTTEDLDFIKDLEYESSATGGFVTKNMTILEFPNLKDFKSSILLSSQKYFRDVLKIADYLELEITTSWANRHKQGDSCGTHIHENALFSGVTYLQTTPESGQILFETPRPHDTIRLEYTEYNIYNGRELSFVPKNNDILFFPSILPHYVTKNNSIIDRYSVAFNFFVKGKLGVGTQYLNLDLKRL
jgi:uncharacterized protein (TIGR02466 family)